MLLWGINLLSVLVILLILSGLLCYNLFPNCELKKLKFFLNSCPNFDQNLFYDHNSYNNSQHTFRNITRCRDSNSFSLYESFNITNPLAAKNIRVIVVPSSNLSHSSELLSLLPFETIQRFANFHGYHFAGLCYYFNKIADPLSVIKYYGAIRPDRNNSCDMKSILSSSRSIIMNYYLRETFHTFGCGVKWIVFVEESVVIMDLSKKIENILQHNTYNNNLKQQHQQQYQYKRKCDMTIQLKPFDIDMSIIIVKVTPNVEKLLFNWMNAHIYNNNRNIFWSGASGWLQFTYLKYLERTYSISFPLNCAGVIDFNFFPKKNTNISESILRSLCFHNYLDFLQKKLSHVDSKFCVIQDLLSLPEGKYNLEESKNEEDEIPSWNNNNNFHFSLRFNNSLVLNDKDQFRIPINLSVDCRIYNIFSYNYKSIDDFDLFNKLQMKWNNITLLVPSNNNNINSLKRIKECNQNDIITTINNVIGSYYEWMSPIHKDRLIKFIISSNEKKHNHKDNNYNNNNNINNKNNNNKTMSEKRESRFSRKWKVEVSDHWN